MLHVFTDIERMLVMVPDVFEEDMSYFITKNVGGRKLFLF